MVLFVAESFAEFGPGIPYFRSGYGGAQSTLEEQLQRSVRRLLGTVQGYVRLIGLCEFGV